VHPKFFYGATGKEESQPNPVTDPWDIAASESVAIRPNERIRKAPPVDLCVAQFIQVYGNETFQGGQIAWRTFWILYTNIPRLNASFRWQVAQATLIGQGLLSADDSGRASLRKQMTYDHDFGSGLID
jgi:hypothetical protein